MRCVVSNLEHPLEAIRRHSRIDRDTAPSCTKDRNLSHDLGQPSVGQNAHGLFGLERLLV